MSGGWIGLLLVACCVAAIVVLTSWRRRAERAELGSVSERWLSEQRGSDRHSSDR